jgi:5-methyltetrahydrofolate--homocysteine methyltransferase
MMGLAPDAYAELVDGFDAAPLAFGANCGVGAADLLVSVLGMTAKRPQAKIIAKANAGVPQWHGAHIHYSGTPELMADYARLAADAGASVIGGCCGNKPAHIAAMRRALDGYTRRERPTVQAIVAALGPLVSPPAEAGAAPRARRRTRETT